MSRLKISFSALLMLIVLSMFSAVAFAAPGGPTQAPLQPVFLNADIVDGVGNATLTWKADPASVSANTTSSYTIKWNGTDINVAKEATGGNAEFTRKGLKPGSYSYEIKAVNAIGSSTAITGTVEITKNESVNKNIGLKNINLAWKSTADSTYNVYWNGALTPINVADPSFAKGNLDAGTYSYDVKVVTLGVEGASVASGNLTVPAIAAHTATKTNPAPGIRVGEKDNNFADSTHRTHGNFQNNTNSCANCHSAHNGENAQLLMKSGEKELCMACHDGTMGFYNVTVGSYAGVFDSHEMSASQHDVGSDLQIKAAPGAFTNAETGTFECSSCHNPHGSVNDRLLNSKVAGKYWSALAQDQKSIELSYTPDPAFAAINAWKGATGLEIKISNGPKDDTNKQRLSSYCAGCHDDYLKSRTTQRADGHYTHTTNSTSQGRACISCHYAHGTDITTLQDTQGKKIADYIGEGKDPVVVKDYMKDVSAKGSSLKRFTNMAVCWSCHQSTHALEDAPGTVSANGVSNGTLDGQGLIESPAGSGKFIFPGKNNIK